jgi:hypothetical protein
VRAGTFPASAGKIEQSIELRSRFRDAAPQVRGCSRELHIASRDPHRICIHKPSLTQNNSVLLSCRQTLPCTSLYYRNYTAPLALPRCHGLFQSNSLNSQFLCRPLLSESTTINHLEKAVSIDPGEQGKSRS